LLQKATLKGNTFPLHPPPPLPHLFLLFTANLAGIQCTG